MANAVPEGITPPAPGLEREEPEFIIEDDIPRNDDGWAAAPDELLEKWVGRKLRKEEATAISGIKNVQWADGLDTMIQVMMNSADTVYLNTNEHNRLDTELYRTDLVGTLGSYPERNCNMNATAAAIYAHRHTVAYRLDRVRELTGLDPMLSEDR